jgi:hypothetical protein
MITVFILGILLSILYKDKKLLKCQITIIPVYLKYQNTRLLKYKLKCQKKLQAEAKIIRNGI